MHKLLNIETLVVMGSALVVAIFFLLPSVQQNFIGYITYRGLYIGDVLFHEMGHAVFAWLFGKPAIPAILTVIGVGNASGVTLQLGHNTVLQLLAVCGLGYGCHYLRSLQSPLFWPAVLFTLVIAALGFTRYPPLIIAYMGHGSAILCGGVLLYRAWLNIIVRTGLERWCNAFFGFFIVLNNMNFARKIVFSPDFRAQYGDSELTMDFVVMMHIMPHWHIEGIAWFTMILGATTLILSWVMAEYFFEDARYGVFGN